MTKNSFLNIWCLENLEITQGEIDPLSHNTQEITSRSLLNISCIFSVFVSRLFIYNSILFSRFLDHFYYHYSKFFVR